MVMVLILKLHYQKEKDGTRRENENNSIFFIIIMNQISPPLCKSCSSNPWSLEGTKKIVRITHLKFHSLPMLGPFTNPKFNSDWFYLSLKIFSFVICSECQSQCTSVHVSNRLCNKTLCQDKVMDDSLMTWQNSLQNSPTEISS